MSTTLYKKDARGDLREWTIETFDNLLIKTFGVVGGELTVHEEYVSGNTLRDEYEQADFMMESKIKAQLKKGYVRSKEAAIESKKAVNELGLSIPMRAQRYDKVSGIDLDSSIYQYKYNGHRCLIHNNDGELIAYSRNGIAIETIPEILAGIKIPDGSTIDGELYCHGTKLQTISSWVKRRQENTKKLTFVCYDAIVNANYLERLDFISSIELGDRALVAKALAYGGSLIELLNQSVGDGYEGLIIRPKTGFSYEADKRSKGLIKVKKFFDDEFIVRDITPSQDGWAILTCATHDGKTFRVSAPGNHYQKRMILENKTNFLNTMVRVEFAEYTNGNIPFHPIATGFRNKFGE